MWLNKLEEKFGRYAIPNLPKIIVLLYAVGFVQKICLYGNHGKPCRAGILRTFQA